MRAHRLLEHLGRVRVPAVAVVPPADPPRAAVRVAAGGKLLEEAPQVGDRPVLLQVLQVEVGEAQERVFRPRRARVTVGHRLEGRRIALTARLDLRPLERRLGSQPRLGGDPVEHGQRVSVASGRRVGAAEPQSDLVRLLAPGRRDHQRPENDDRLAVLARGHQAPGLVEVARAALGRRRRRGVGLQRS